MQHRVEFDRVGRNRDVKPLHVLALGEADLCHAIRNHVQPHLRSRDFDVMLHDDGKSGWLSCGMHVGGKFTIHEIET